MSCLRWPGLLRAHPVRYFAPLQVRVVQHKQTKDLYALKYINKARCVKQRAVSNIVQERRLLEEVRCNPPKSSSPRVAVIRPQFRLTPRIVTLP